MQIRYNSIYSIHRWHILFAVSFLYCTVLKGDVTHRNKQVIKAITDNSCEFLGQSCFKEIAWREINFISCRTYRKILQQFLSMDSSSLDWGVMCVYIEPATCQGLFRSVEVPKMRGWGHIRALELVVSNLGHFWTASSPNLRERVTIATLRLMEWSVPNEHTCRNTFADARSIYICLRVDGDLS